MHTLLDRVQDNLIGRIHGPLRLRLVLQPAMAAIIALRDGIQDARLGAPPYFWSLFTQAQSRWAWARSGLKTLARVLLLGALMETAYQLLVSRQLYPGEALIVLTGLVLAPYIMVRGPANRLARRWMNRTPISQQMKAHRAALLRHPRSRPARKTP